MMDEQEELRELEQTVSHHDKDLKDLYYQLEMLTKNLRLVLEELKKVNEHLIEIK